MATTTFPTGFIWGTATAAHQVEGGLWNNDWWAWEHAQGTPCAEPSGDACDHYHRYPDDLTMLGELGFNAYRFSVEWSRVEPEPGEFSTVALDHYAAMAETCRRNGLKPIVTLHHFTTPRWVAEGGGWAEPVTADRFAGYAGRVATRLEGLVDTYCTINEPNIVATNGYLTGLFPPGERDFDRRAAANNVFVTAHRKAVEAVKATGEVRAGLTLSMREYQAVDGGEDMVELLRGPMEDVFLEAVRGDDFFGVQTYTRMRVGPTGLLPVDAGAETTIMGYEFYPEALEATIRRAWAMTGGVPILVTENGVAVSDDRRRVEFVRRALRGVAACLDDGIDVRGYLYWSALDNFEWALGYVPTFGLIGVDRVTMDRTVKESARWLGGVATNNTLEDAE